MIAKCYYCKSIFVCWNWFHQTKEKLQEYNPNLKIESDCWGHECWRCNGVFETPNKVKTGLPYRLLRLYGFIKYRIFRVDD